MNTYKKPLNNIESLRNQIQQLQLDLTKQKQNIISKIYGNRSFETTPTMNQEENYKSALFSNKISKRQDTQLHQDWNIYKSKQIERDNWRMKKRKNQISFFRVLSADLLREYQLKKQQVNEEFDAKMKYVQNELQKQDQLNKSLEQEQQKKLVSSFRKNSNKEKLKVRFQGDYYVRARTEH
ncbi:unnamed protein product (macronuclear) [Paramecium tetraurelia]|uniref:Uncharacterized protein n=1 Tax=Paramecium tetraurelia TaxID=5888 RepID=A0DME2_PARTE|nr:uncharacterized protein GSPATT00018427001 [Paramecium tetraurelia]CAK84209.1 unnamed protein product [Paramecium tetraurelia]|eukprot:XP_001451606.1 hypothetical protein (macronuclear) [Paramecium tetraurelia strain d4-2]